MGVQYVRSQLDWRTCRQADLNNRGVRDSTGHLNWLGGFNNRKLVFHMLKLVAVLAQIGSYKHDRVKRCHVCVVTHRHKR